MAGRVARRERHAPGPALREFLQRQLELRLQVGAAHRPAMDAFVVSPGAPAAGERPSAAAEQRFEEVAEAAWRALAARPGPPFALAASRRRREVHAVLPAGAEAVVLLAFLGVAEDLIGLVDLFEFFFRGFLFRRRRLQIGVILARQLPIGVLDRLLGRVAGHAEDLVVISKFDAHAI